MPTPEIDMQDWQIMQHEAAARQVCYNLNVSPDESPDGGPPRWWYWAVKMAEHEMMVQVMRQFGRPV